jgi:hypothetical protein
MGVGIGGYREVAVSQPFFYLLKRYAVGEQKRGTTVAEIVKTHTAETVIFQKLGKLAGKVVRLDTVVESVSVNINTLLRVVGFTT